MSISDRDRTLCARMLEEIRFISKTTLVMSHDDFMRDEIVQHAVCMSLITIGEYANHLSDRFIENHPEIEWIQIIAVRNIAAHGYWQLNMEQIWQAIADDLPTLQKFLISQL